MKQQNKNITIDTLTNSVFLKSEQYTYSYLDLELFTVNFKTFLEENSYQTSKPIAFYCHSSDKLVLAIAACWKLGIPFVPLSPQTPLAKIKTQIKKTKPSILFTDVENKIISSGLTTLHINEIKYDKNLSTNELDNINIYHKIDINAVAGYFFTSGTSGNQKIVVIKRRQIHSAANSSAQNFKPDVNNFWLLCLPLNHVGGISIILRSIIYRTGIYRLDGFDLVTIENLLSKDGSIQIASLVPTMLHRLLENPSFKTHSKFKTILLGGAPSTKNLLKTAKDRKVPYTLSYGMTETCAQIVANTSDFFDLNNTAQNKVGVIFSPNQIQIRADDGNTLQQNKLGSIWLRGPQVFDGYLEESDNAGVFDSSGWFHTGDFGYLNENNELFIEARRDDLIITGGENVNPIEVEEAILAIKNIHEVAVLGIPDEEWGEQIVAFITTKASKRVDVISIKELLRKKLLNYKIPKQIIWVEKMPKTDIGKIKKRELLNKFLNP